MVIAGNRKFFAWYKNDVIHRDDRDRNGKLLPAAIYIGEMGKIHMEWFREGKPFNDGDLPHVIGPEGQHVWVDENGERHQENDFSAFVLGTRLEWYEH